MKKIALSILLAVSMVLFGVKASFAESVVEKDGLVFKVDANGLAVTDLDLNPIVGCTVPALEEIDLSTATDVLVVGKPDETYTALVTTHPEGVDGPLVIEPFNVTACYPEVEPVPEVPAVEACEAYLEGNQVHVPCLVHTDSEGIEKVYHVIFSRNGNSHNFKLDKALVNELLTHHHHAADDDDDVVEEVVVEEVVVE